MDGYGLRDDAENNAVQNARTPHLDQYFAACPHTVLSASGLDVGLPAGQSGNSQVGHTNIGAGRVVFQDLPRITRAIEDGTFFQNEAYLSAMAACRETGAALHLMGLLSDGGVHSHITHLYALLRMAKAQGVERVWIHAFLDGRDVPPTSGKGFVESCAAMCRTLGIGQIATVMGRCYAMDRDCRWERLQKAYDAMTLGEGVQDPDPVHAVQDFYHKQGADEFMPPTVCAPHARIQEGDSVIFFNFRPDRARELARAFADPDFTGVERKGGFFPVQFVCTTEYDADMPNVSVAFPKESLSNTVGEYLSQLGLTQLRIAETEKYAHVTSFFNGGVETVYPGEDRVLVPSPKVPTYDLKPDMSAREIADEAVARIESGAYDVIVLNFANCDVVGHTGIYEAARLAVETVDECVSTVVDATAKMGGISIITADHGNAEQMTDDSGQPFTGCTTDPVPFVIIGADVKLRAGRLADIAPTMLDLMGLSKPMEMTGETLIESK